MGPMGASRGAVETAAAGAWPSWGRLTWTSMRSQNRTFCCGVWVWVFVPAAPVAERP